MLDRVKIFTSQTSYNASKCQFSNTKAEAEKILSKNHFCGLILN